MKRISITASAIAASALLLAGCSGAESAADESSEAPITVKTGQGEVEVPANPERIVALQSAAADVAAALGKAPSAVAGSTMAGEDGRYPWQQNIDAETVDTTLVGEEDFTVDVEKVAALEPDLIFAAPWNVTDKKVYEQLSEIAPVVTPDSEAANPDWDSTVKTVGSALGLDDEAEDLISSTQSELGEEGKELGVQGKTYQLISPQRGSIFFGNAKPLELYGLEPGKHQSEDEVNSYELSFEKMSELDADYLLIWPLDEEGKKQVEENPAYDSLPSVKNGNAEFVDTEFASALNAASPASLTWLNELGGMKEILGK